MIDACTWKELVNIAMERMYRARITLKPKTMFEIITDDKSDDV